MSKSTKNFNFTFWGIIVSSFGVFGAIATVFTVPEFRCSIGLLADTCTPLLKEVELITQTETGEALAGVKVQFIAKGAPETQHSDDNGYVKAKISSKGDVRVNLSISGYPTQDFNINLANDQNTVRTIRFSKSGQPKVASLPALPPVIPLIPSPPTSPTRLTSGSATYEDNFIRAKLIGSSFSQSGTISSLQTSLSIENKTTQDLLLANEVGGVKVISDLGETSGCEYSGLNGVIGAPSNPSYYSRLNPNQKVTVSLTKCTNLTASSKANNFSINMPLVRLNNDQPTQFILDISGVPLKR
jgi:hypothetical protein